MTSHFNGKLSRTTPNVHGQSDEDGSGADALALTKRKPLDRWPAVGENDGISLEEFKFNPMKACGDGLVPVGRSSGCCCCWLRSVIRLTCTGIGTTSFWPLEPPVVCGFELDEADLWWCG